MFLVDVAVAVARAADSSGGAPRSTPTSTTPTPSSTPATRHTKPPLQGFAGFRVGHAGLVHLRDLPDRWASAPILSASIRARENGELARCLHVPSVEQAHAAGRHRSFDDYDRGGFDAISSSTYVFHRGGAAQGYLTSAEGGAGVGCVRQVEHRYADAPAGARVTGVDTRGLPMPAALFGTRTTVSLRAGSGRAFATFDDGVLFAARNVLVEIHFLSAGAPPPLALESKVLQEVLHRLNWLAHTHHG